VKQLLILSGKGGTGKTTIAGAFIRLACAKAYADCDVDAPNLHLIMARDIGPRLTDYYGMPRAEIDPGKCVGCGECVRNCRFDAILDGDRCKIDPYSCEGCGVCEAVCPAGAVSLKPVVAGELKLYHKEDRVFSTAQLKMGGGTSGKLVTEVKKQMKSAAYEGAELAIIDGSPGIGCPVIASLSGADMVLIVAEPSISGISDMKRIVKTAEVFHVRIAVCINKYDVSPVHSRKIQEYCKTENLPFAGVIPFDPEAVRAVNNGLAISEVDCPSGVAAKEVFGRVMGLLFQGFGESSH